MTIRAKAFSSVKWSGFSQLARLVAQYATTIILARLLSPSDFGLMGMALVITGFLGIFSDFGTSAAIVQRKIVTDELLSSLFWFNLGVGFLITVALFLIAPIIGMLYREDGVVAIIRVLSATFLISGAGALLQVRMERSLEFGTLAKLEMISVGVGAAAGIGLALNNARVWSLVFQSLVTVSVTTVLLWLSNPWRPRGFFRWSEILGVSHFSLNLTGFTVLNYFARNVDYLLIGRYLGAQELGYYALAYRILLFPLQNISAVVGRVLYPVFASFQDDDTRFAAAYLAAVRGIAFISFPLMIGMFALAAPLVRVVFGAKWEPAIPLIMILAPVGFIQSIGATVGAIYQAKGRTDWMFRWGLAAGTFVVLALVVGLRWGVLGVAAAYAAASAALLYPSFHFPFQLIGLRFGRMLRELRPPFIGSCITLLAILAIRSVLPPQWSDTLALVLGAGVGVSAYLAVGWLTNRQQFEELWALATARMSAE